MLLVFVKPIDFLRNQRPHPNKLKSVSELKIQKFNLNYAASQNRLD